MALNEAAELAVALGTATLAAATFKLAKDAAKQAKSMDAQAKATRELVDIARRQLAATGEPQLIPDSQTPGVFAQDGTVVVQVRNIGAAPAQIVETTMDLSGGKAIRGHPWQDVVREEPVGISFGPHELLIKQRDLRCRVRYEGAGSGARRELVVLLGWTRDGTYVVRHDETHNR